MKSFRTTLKNGVPQLGFCVMYPAPGAIERIGADWDWIWIDGQHGQLGYGDVLNLVRACDLVDRPAFVRVAGHDFGAIGLALDSGASGVIVPCVDTPEQARNVVNAAKFPPLGKRSFGGRRPIDLHGRKYADTANEEVLLIVQIESPQAIENVNEIAAIEGVDALFLGPDDITLRRGYSMEQARTKEMLEEDMAAVAEAARRHGKFAVMVGGGEEMLALCARTKFHMIVASGDVPILANTSRQLSIAARLILKESAEGTIPDRSGGEIKSLY